MARRYSCSGRHRSILEVLRSLISIDLKDGRTLLYSLDKRTGTPVILRGKSLPENVWASSDAKTFVIPANLLRPKLNQAGKNFADRYEALTQVIGEFDKKRQP